MKKPEFQGAAKGVWMFDTKVLHRLGLLLLLGMAGAGCVDEKIVFRDRELFEEPPPGAANFLGYTNQETKLTVCGNCHVGAQAEWEDTQHADAWVSLEESGHAAASCEGCHTVSDRGNAATAQVGWDATRDTRYHDVQCESCHGAGQTHVENPQSTNLPLAPMSVGLNAETGCGECHSGTHHPFVEEWAASRHGQVQEHAAERAECAVCHEASAIFASWGINTNYIEKGNPDVHLGITCTVCHDPHARDNAAQLRFPIDVPVEETNLCMRCHHKRGQPDPTSSRGPHSPEGPLLLGDAGWFPPNFTLPPGAVVATHGTDRNPRLCAGCHVNSFEVTDPATGAFVFNATGHLFAATPCLDAQGVPTAEDCAITERSFQSCADIGCHSPVAARSAQVAAESRIDLLAATLTSMIDQIPASEFSTSDNRYSTGEGARFNRDLAVYPGSAVHNPFLIEALITSSIKQITIDYGITSPPGVSLENQLQKNATTN
jgi:predicted CXXCH cytochrome family protein